MTATTVDRRSPWLLAQLSMLTHGGGRVGRQAGPAFRITRRSAGSMLRRWPAAISMTRRGTGSLARTIDALPRRTVESMTAGSLGFGAGLYLGRSPRVLKAIAAAPAVMLGASLLRRRDRGGQSRRADDSGSAFRRGTEITRPDDDGSPVVAAPLPAMPAA
jgi:hypothetical protein